MPCPASDARVRVRGRSDAFMGVDDANGTFSTSAPHGRFASFGTQRLGCGIRTEPRRLRPHRQLRYDDGELRIETVATVGKQHATVAVLRTPELLRTNATA